MKNGLLLVDKEPGCTSHDVVQQARRILRQKKIGHCGTLDPSATGLLVLTAGSATRLTRFLIQAPKIYQGTVRLGIETETYDATGEVVAQASTEGVTQEALITAMAELEGTYEQVAPRYSAKKIKGQKFYELARRGEEVPVQSKTVTIFELSPQGELEDGLIGFRLACTSGTYARTIAHDLGAKLGCGGHLASLQRLQVGGFKIDAARELDDLRERLAPPPPPSATEGADPPQPPPEPIEVAEGALKEASGGAWIPFDEIPLPFGQVVTDPQQERRLTHGQTVLVRDLEGEEGDWVQLVNQRNRFLAVGTIVERIGQRGVGVIQPKVVFV